MAQNETTGIYQLTTPVTMTFPNLMEAKAVMLKGKATGDPKFSANFEFAADHPDLQALKAKAVEIARAMWPNRDFASDVAANNFSFPFTNGDKLADKAKAKNKDREFSRGKAVLTSRSKFEPKLAVLENGKLVDYEGDRRALAKNKFYSGVLVLAEINFVAYPGVGQNPDGVTAYLNGVVSLNKGDRVAGGSSLAETFKDYVGHATDVDPTAGAGNLADEIPF